MIAGPERLMLLEEVAPLVGLAPSTLAEHCRRGRFPCRRLPELAATCSRPRTCRRTSTAAN